MTCTTHRVQVSEILHAGTDEAAAGGCMHRHFAPGVADRLLLHGGLLAGAVASVLDGAGALAGPKLGHLVVLLPTAAISVLLLLLPSKICTDETQGVQAMQPEGFCGIECSARAQEKHANLLCASCTSVAAATDTIALITRQQLRTPLACMTGCERCLGMLRGGE